VVDLRDLVGRPFESGGRGPSFDCWGLVREVYRRYGIELPDYPIAAVDHEQIARQVAQDLPSWREVRPPYPVPAVAVFRLAGPLPCHTGAVISPGRFLHAREKTFSCTEDLAHPYWGRHLVGVYVPGWI
jgi:cell wall-associated NlpC family hydrolase